MHITIIITLCPASNDNALPADRCEWCGRGEAIRYGVCDACIASRRAEEMVDQTEAEIDARRGGGEWINPEPGDQG